MLEGVVAQELGPTYWCGGWFDLVLFKFLKT